MVAEKSRVEQSSRGSALKEGGVETGGGTLSGGRAHPQARSRSALADVDAEDEDVPG